MSDLKVESTTKLTKTGKTPKKSSSNLPKNADGTLKGGPGRPPGSLDKKTLLNAKDTLANKGINPTEQILLLIPTLKPAEQLQAWALLLKYTQPTPQSESNSDLPAIQITYKSVE